MHEITLYKMGHIHGLDENSSILAINLALA